MVNSLATGVSGMQRAQENINLIGDNLANINTNGYRKSTMSFEDSFYQTYQTGAMPGTNSSGAQIGTGVVVGATSASFSQGRYTAGTSNTHLAINGDRGFFVLAQDGNQYVTRDGSFSLDAQGYLINKRGMRVQGYNDPARTATGDLKIDIPAGQTGAGEVPSEFRITDRGVVEVKVGENWLPRGQILLQDFINPGALTKAGHNLFANLAAAGARPLAAPGSNALGMLSAGILELSNVDLATEFADLIAAQRAFQANARLITTSDELLQESIALKR
ncbi:MAG: flagellar hook-basal body protein [Verrucomicrobia bacterium]|nr:flagellar hook-basal body protein [Verrucomicrobiota bacterium]